MATSSKVIASEIRSRTHSQQTYIKTIAKDNEPKYKYFFINIIRLYLWLCFARIGKLALFMIIA